ncbi:hypothetical protein [Micromonospora sp. HUAS LYJ1]|uniref:hypothetical protein n=1 Tax=Micromonospora sp. HUAS LYJ1 TaxID=3061626 RepID=UPI00267292C1|nr:hypothetical protein [Micromonospora sp. HUAS LYJ1]WKU03775.1 hypothetical protein Q2K16_23465 [Micromonospora sp. HUAS LYJ1]
MHTNKLTAANVLVAAAVASWAAFILLATVADETHHLYTALGLAGALTVVGLAVNTRQTGSRGERVITVAVAAAPREAYYRGYGDAAQDAFGRDDDQGDTTDLRNP